MGQTIEKEKQKRLKIISKIIFIIAKIARIFVRIAIVLVSIAAIFGIIAVGCVNVKNDNSFEINTGSGKIEYKQEDGELIIVGDSLKNGIQIDEENQNIVVNKEEGSTHIKFLDIKSKKDLEKIAEVFSKNSKPMLYTCLILGSVFFIASLILLGRILRNLEKLFKNINEGDTPFTLENAEHIKKMSFLMIASTVVSAISIAVFSFIIEGNMDINIGFSVMTILFLYSLSLVFEYGSKLQSNSNTKIYDDEN